jgi:hypothetical protein
MAFIVPVLVGAAAATAVGVAVGTVAAAAAVSYFVTTAVTGLVLGAVATALAPKASLPSIPSLSLPGGGGSPTSPTQSSLGIDQTLTIRQPVAAHRVIYGRTRVGGTIVFLQTTNENSFLHMVVTIAGHEVDAIEKIFLDDAELTLDGSGFGFAIALNAYLPNGAPLFSPPLARVKYNLGSDDQAAFTDLILESGGNWTGAHRLRGIACAYIRLEYRQEEIFPFSPAAGPNTFPNGIPNITFQVRGKKLYDPRTETTAWSANSALVLNDFLTNTKFGLAANYATEIDETQLIAAANICDEDIPLNGGGTENRYETNGVLETSDTPESIINGILGSMAGKAVYTGGKWRILPGAYYAPTLAFDEDDLRGGIKIQSLVSRRENFNAVKGVFSSRADNFIITDFPPIISETFLEQDNNEQVFKSIELGFTTSSSMAQRIAKIDLLRARQQITLTLPLKLQGLKAVVGDIIQVNNTRMGWTNKPFEVTNMTVSMGEAPGVDMELREIASSVYDWTSSEEQILDPAPNTELPNPFFASPPGITITDEIRIVNQQIATVLIVDVSGATFFQVAYEVQARKSGDANFINLGQASANRFELMFVEDGVVYDVRARTINKLGAKSEFATGSHQTVGQTEPPQNVSDFAINIVGTEAHCRWTPVTDLDLSHYVIRHSRLTTGALYSDAMTVADKISRPGNSAVVPAMTGTYLIKAVDKSGIESLSAASSVAIIDAIPNLNLVETVTEDPTFAGAKTDVVLYESSIILDSDVLFDDKSGLFDDAEGSFDFAGGGFALTGTYDFDNSVDLGAVYTSRVTAVVEFVRIDVVNSFDAALGLFDARSGLFDGDASNFGDANVELYVSTTEDDPAGAPTYSAYRKFVVGDYKARALRFRAILTTENSNVTPQVTTLEVTVDMPERTVAGEDIVSGTDAGGKVVTFTRAFKVSPALGISAQNLVSGDFYEIVSKSAGGFTIRFKDSGGTVVNRTFDFVARGYGEFISA